MDTTGPNATIAHGRSMRCERHVVWLQLLKAWPTPTCCWERPSLTVSRLGERLQLGYPLPAKREGDIDFSPAFCGRLTSDGCSRVLGACSRQNEKSRFEQTSIVILW